MRGKEIGTRSDLRDAYLFAAPIVSDRDSVEGDHTRFAANIRGSDRFLLPTAFNAKMMEDPAKPRTMWRVTSNGDFGALIS